jgi:hypothetical protein
VLYDARTGRPIPNRIFTGAQVRADTPSDNLVLLAWAPSEDLPNPLFARFLLVLPDSNVILAIANSGKFKE